MKKTKIVIAVTAAAALSGCGEDEQKVKVIYKDPTPEQIQDAVDKHLAVLNNESAELKQFLAQIQKTNPDVTGARYAYENGQRVMKVALEKFGGGITEYTIPLATGAFVGYSGAALADKLVSYTFKSVNGKPDCDLEDLLEGDDDCRTPPQQPTTSSTGSTGTTINNYNGGGGGSSFIFLSFPSYSYDTRDSYQSTTRKDTKLYNEQRVKQTARERSEAIRKKNSIGSINSKPSTKTSSSDSKMSSSKYESSHKSKGEVKKGTLSQSRQVFSTNRSTSRASGMTSGGGRGWGG